MICCMSVASFCKAERYGWINPVAAQLIEAFWPGFLGVIVEKRASVPDIVTAGRETVLLACIPDLGYALARGADGPIVASSANRTGTPPALDMTDVYAFAQQADEPIDAVIEGGNHPLESPNHDR
jgi:L-threonylcarbamoyladenylate synthase